VSLSRIVAIARRIADQFRRDRRSLALLVVAPLAIMALLGYVIRDDKPIESRLGIVNLDGPAGGPLVAALQAAAGAAGVPIVDVGTDETSGRNAIRGDQADVVLVIVPDPAAGRPALTLITSGQSPADDSARIQAIAGLAGRVISAASQVQIQHVTVYGSPNADLLDTFAPAVIGFFGFFFVFVLTGISFLRERTGGTLERLLATPVRRSEIVFGYSLGFGFFATIQVIVILVFTLGRLTVPPVGPLASFDIGLGIADAGSPLLAFAVIFLTAIGAVNLAIFLSTYARTELQILEFIPLVVVPQAFLAGIFWPVDSLPDPLQPVAHVLPMTYAIDGLRAVLIRGADLGDAAVRLDLAFLIGVAILFVGLAATTIRREIS
jgi:ABC-2 type transport system permease protein